MNEDSAKYVMIDDIKPVIFHKGLSHDAFKAIGKITSAGFVRIYLSAGEIDVAVHGESDSLKLKPNAQDADLIKMALGHWRRR